MSKEKAQQQGKKFRVAFFGTPDFAVPVLEALMDIPEITMVTVVTQPDKPIGRKQVVTSTPVKKVAEKYQVPVCQPDRIKSVKFEKCARDVDLDIAIVVAYGKIIPQKLLDIPKQGWINIHGSLLPKYRGASPIQAAILSGEKETGVTLMKIDEGLDTGDIISQKKIPIDSTDNFESLHDKLSHLGADLMKESLLDYLNGKIKSKPQDNSIATKTAIIKKDDGKIDWTKNAEDIEHHVRAYNPWPGSFCKFNSKTFKILSVELATEDIQLNPGKVVYKDNSLIIGCGKGLLKLTKVQLEGKKPQTAVEFVNGNPDFKEAQLT